MIPLADLEGMLDPQPEFLDALLWEPEYDIVSDDNDSEYNVKEGITLDSSVQLIGRILITACSIDWCPLILLFVLQ